MVTISKPLSSGQAQAYHKLEFTSESQNYWKQDGTVQGEWQGRLADAMGLAGKVSEEHFARLSEGQNPQTGEQMVQHREAQEYNKRRWNDDQSRRTSRRLGRHVLSSKVRFAHCSCGRR